MLEVRASRVIFTVSKIKVTNLFTIWSAPPPRPTCRYLHINILYLYLYTHIDLPRSVKVLPFGPFFLCGEKIMFFGGKARFSLGSPILKM